MKNFQNIYRNYIGLASAFLFLTGSLLAQDDHDHMHMAGNPKELGKINFLITCNPETQQKFETAVAMLHSFWYEECEKAFREAAELDPSCGIAYWGIAMSMWHPLWQRTDTATLRKGWDVIEKGKAIGGKNELENGLIAAVESYYKDWNKLDELTRTTAYENAMKTLYVKYPENTEIAAFYSLALLGTVWATPPPGDKTYAKQKQADSILEKIFTSQPNHPGASHYIIHSFDYPDLASLALPAARNYSKIAPSSPHALHMPSHIFTRLGLWDESIQSNIASKAAAEYNVNKTLPGYASYDQLHAMDYLVYAYLQKGDDKKARAIADQLKPMDKVDREYLAAAFAFAAIPTRMALERHQWEQAESLQLHPAGFSWNRNQNCEAIIHFGRALGYAKMNNVAKAADEIQEIKLLYDTLLQQNSKYWAVQTKILQTEAEAWKSFAEKNVDDALVKMKSATLMEDSTEKHPVTPGAILPSHEQFGDMLLLVNKPGDALAEYQKSLAIAPNRFNSLYGAAKSAHLSGDDKKAKEYYSVLVNQCSDADTKLPELEEARAFVALK